MVKRSRLARAPMPAPASLRATGDGAIDEQVDKLAAKQVDLQNDDRQGRLELAFVAPASGDIRVQHGLGRTPIRWPYVACTGGPQMAYPIFADESVMIWRNPLVIPLDIIVEVW